MAHTRGSMLMLNRSQDTVFDTALRVVEAGGHQVGEVDRDEHTITLTARPGSAEATTAPFTYELAVADDETGGVVLGVIRSTEADEVSRDDKRAARQTAKRLVADVQAALERVEPTPAEAKMLAELPRAKRPLLARFTRRRALPAALLLLIVYVAPLAVVWGVGRATDAGLLGSSYWLPLTLAFLLGVGSHIALTWWLGAWVQWVQWGEEYMVTFGLFAGYALGWWRFAVQLVSFILAVLLTGGVEDGARLNQMTNPQTAALPAYAQRAPAPEGAEAPTDGEVDQSEYYGRPNATFTRSYDVPLTWGTAELTTYLEDPRWADGVDGGEPIGTLGEIECTPEIDTCEADVTPPDGGPVVHTVNAQLQDYSDFTLTSGEAGQTLVVEIEYVEPE